MRMWMVDPRVLCRKHLLGEHVESHMFQAHLILGKAVTGYIQKNLLEPLSIVDRHNDLAMEMERRGYQHKSPIQEISVYHLSDLELWHVIDREAALQELLNRCKTCRDNFNNLK